MAEAKADEETAKLRGKYESRARTLQNQLQAAQDRASVLEAESQGRQQEELLSTAGSLLSGFLGGRRRSSSLAREMRSAASRRSRTRAAGERLEAAQSKAGTITAQLAELESELSDDVLRITAAWTEKAAAIDVVPVSLEKTDVQVAQLALAWIPVG